MKPIPISINSPKYKGKYSAQVDDELFTALNKFKWFVMKCASNKIYARRSCGKGLMHQMVFELIGLENRSLFIDHIDGNGLNNQKSNLRHCTQRQNLCNMRKRKSKTSDYVGVSWHKSAKAWAVQIKHCYKTVYIGCFKTEIEAAIAYNEAAKKYHGEFANLNKI